MEEPPHALAAPSHRQPYGWYARLRAQRPLFFDAVLGMWVVSDPDLLHQALRHPALRVRPAAEPVPGPLRGRAVGEVFSLLVRMNDGEFHRQHRPAVEQVAASMSDAEVTQAAEAATRDLAARTDPDALLSAIPVQTMARLLGVAPGALEETVGWVHDFTRGIAPGADAKALARADLAAHGLMAQGEASGLGRVAAANRVAFMHQTLDAGAGLLGNAIVRAQAGASPEAGELVTQVTRSDPAIHNTRRFAASELTLGGERIRQNDAVLLVLVPATFGGGPHGCPGERIAMRIAASALRTLQSSAALARFGPVQGYRPLPNARVPVFASQGTPWSP
ncbi:MAG: putative cytochrome p450 oxidoreductase [Ramlibacter sp.]|nr:putative cytochrome p450 oxidoreductase [Ramlibacter sp.]